MPVTVMHINKSCLALVPVSDNRQQEWLICWTEQFRAEEGNVISGRI
jgi:hypothetical protein